MAIKKFTTLGRVLWVSRDRLYKAIGRHLYYSNNDGEDWSLVASLPFSNLKSLSILTDTSARLCRTGFHHLNVLDNGSLLVFANQSIYLLEKKSSRFNYVGSMRSSKPLVVSVQGNTIVYGEYTRNAKRKPVPLYKSDDAGLTWYCVHQFEDIRHIHGVFFDKFSDKYWITSGDSDLESCIWRTDRNFSKFEKVLSGSQKYRAVQLSFDPEFIYFGSDAPHEANHIYRLSRENGRVDRLMEVGAPVFFGTTISNHYFFSTAIEKSTYMDIESANLWSSKGGSDWQCVFNLKRSLLPLRIFQNGQILFPSGPGDDKNLWFWSIATSGNNKNNREKNNEKEKAV